MAKWNKKKYLLNLIIKEILTWYFGVFKSYKARTPVFVPTHNFGESGQ